MPPSPVEPVDLLDLKLLPAWVKEPVEGNSYAHYEGDEGEPKARGRGREREPHRGPQGRERPGRRGPPGKDDQRGRRPSDRRGKHASDRRPAGRHDARERGPRPVEDRQKAYDAIAARIAVRFLPQPPALENVVGQIKSSAVAYSVFALARLFLEKAERYEVQLKAKPEFPLFRLGEGGTVSADRDFLENNAFRLASEDFYKVEVTQSEPIKGNFSSIARCRLSGLLLGPTNHHGYQPRLRTLYEQRFSRRMSFPEYQRQIEIVSDPAAVEKWKEEARNVTTFTAKAEETPAAFANAAEAERHFRQTYLPDLIRPVDEVTLGGVASRQLLDRNLRHLIEEAWSRETRSPSQMMQELAKSFREAGLQIFRHRRGMLFASSVRVRPFAHDQTNVSPQVKAILELLAANAGMNRKDLAEKLLVDRSVEDAEARKLALASDLRWLISEGYIIEFNDGSLDLPRAKPVAAVATAKKASDETVVIEAAASETVTAQPEKTDGPGVPADKEAPAEVEAMDPIAQGPSDESPEPPDNPIAQ